MLVKTTQMEERVKGVGIIKHYLRNENDVNENKIK